MHSCPRIYEYSNNYSCFAVLKYRRDTDSSFSDKLSKLSLHSIRKKSTRLSMRLAGVTVSMVFTQFGVAWCNS